LPFLINFLVLLKKGNSFSLSKFWLIWILYKLHLFLEKFYFCFFLFYHMNCCISLKIFLDFLRTSLFCFFVQFVNCRIFQIEIIRNKKLFFNSQEKRCKQIGLLLIQNFPNSRNQLMDCWCCRATAGTVPSDCLTSSLHSTLLFFKGSQQESFARPIELYTDFSSGEHKQRKAQLFSILSFL